MKRLLITIPFIIAIVVGCGTADPLTIPTPTSTATNPHQQEAVPAPELPPPPPAPEVIEENGTLVQQNAFESAKSYLDYTAFSRTGLIAQLEYEGYLTADATWAVDRVTVDWNEQAAESAKSYLEYTSFSRSGLIDQLIFEGFTTEQAEYGVTQVGL